MKTELTKAIQDAAKNITHDVFERYIGPEKMNLESARKYVADMIEDKLAPVLRDSARDADAVENMKRAAEIVAYWFKPGVGPTELNEEYNAGVGSYEAAAQYCAKLLDSALARFSPAKPSGESTTTRSLEEPYRLALQRIAERRFLVDGDEAEQMAEVAKAALGTPSIVHSFPAAPTATTPSSGRCPKCDHDIGPILLPNLPDMKEVWRCPCECHNTTTPSEGKELSSPATAAAKETSIEVNLKYLTDLTNERDALRKCLSDIVLQFPITTDLGRQAQEALNMTRSEHGFLRVQAAAQLS